VCLRLVSQSVSLLGGAGACHHHHHQHQQGLDVDQAGRPAQGKARRAAPRSQGRNIRIGWIPSSVSKAERAQGKGGGGTHGRTHGRRVTKSKPLAALTDGGWAAVSLLCEQLQPHRFQPSHRICLLGLYSRCQQQSRRSVMGQISMPPAADTWGPDSNLHGQLPRAMRETAAAPPRLRDENVCKREIFADAQRETAGDGLSRRKEMRWYHRVEAPEMEAKPSQGLITHHHNAGSAPLSPFHKHRHRSPSLSHGKEKALKARLAEGTDSRRLTQLQLRNNPRLQHKVTRVSIIQPLQRSYY
jgi:hypothetical protein